MDRLLKAAQLREEDLEKTEELKMNHLTIEEVAARRLELRRMRELMFRAEVKAKRIAKIKSKTYRRLKRKERERLAAKLDDGGDDDDEDARVKHELERARERATLKHKNTGKWAKSLKARGHMEENQRRDINEMLDRGERLKRRIQGVGSEDEDEESDSDEEKDADEIKASAFEELRDLTSECGPDNQDGASGVFKMKFMAEAAARQANENRRITDEFLVEMGAQGGSDDGRVDREEDSEVSITRTGGRVTFNPGVSVSQRSRAGWKICSHSPVQQSSRPIGSLHSDTSSVTLKSTDFPPESTTAEFENGPPSSFARRNVPNPWLASQSNEDSARAPRKANEIVVSKQSSAAEKSKNKLRKIKDKGTNARETTKADAELEISTTEFLTLNALSTTSKPPIQPQRKHAPEVEGLEEGADHNNELEEQEQNLQSKGRAGRTAAFEQRDLVARAFSGDNVIQVCMVSYLWAVPAEINLGLGFCRNKAERDTG